MCVGVAAYHGFRLLAFGVCIRVIVPVVAVCCYENLFIHLFIIRERHYNVLIR
jgi:hypothetical protein